jgi:hypothetical protein
LIALASSTSVGAWAIWEKYPIIWSTIIVASQIATVIKPYFPYSKYVREFNIKCSKVDVIQTELEFLFERKQTAGSTELRVIEKEYMTLKRKINAVLEFSDDLLFVVSEKMEKLADEKLEDYLRINYGIQ